MNISRKEEMKSDRSRNVVDFQKYRERALKEKTKMRRECPMCKQTESALPEVIQLLLILLRDIGMRK